MKVMALVFLVVTCFLAGCERAGTPSTGGDKASATADQVPADAERSRSPESIIGRNWQWVRTITPVERVDANDPARYTLLLGADGRAAIRFDCNMGGGDYEIGEGKLTFGPMLSTRMACPPDSQDGQFMSQLQQVTAFFVDDGSLFLEMPYDSGTMRFERVAE